MRNVLSIVLGTVALVACGGETPPPAAPTTNSTPAPVDTVAAAPTAAPAAPVEAPKPAAPKLDVTGKWCGKQVPDAASCKGKDVMFVELNAAGDAITGQICEGFNKDCMPLETSTFTGNNLSLGATIKQGAKKDTLKGTFTLGTDDVLTGELVSTKAKAPIKKSLYRISSK